MHADRFGCIDLDDALTCRRSSAPASVAALAYFCGNLHGTGVRLPKSTRTNLGKKGLAERQTQIIALSEAISARATQLIDRYALSHGLRLADALIGATALEHQLTLLTANVKHFAPIEGLVLEGKFCHSPGDLRGHSSSRYIAWHIPCGTSLVE
jgi:predicted nucleic acid-binding protein